MSVGWPWRLFLFSIMLLLAVGLAYAGLVYGYQPYLTSKIEDVDKKTNELLAQVSIKDKEDFIKFYSQTTNLKDILENHVFSSKIFTLLEKRTSQKVYYTDFDFNLTERKLSLSGLAESYSVLGEQLASFDEEPMIEKYNLENSRTNENLVQFKIAVVLSPNLLK